MQPTQPLIDELFREKVRRARQMSPEDKLMAGPRLFEFACEVAKAGIREQFPDAEEPRVQEILFQRLALRRQLDKHELRRTLKERGHGD
jgi:hypothetical protein